MSCQHLNELTLENMISKANYPVFRCEECMRVGDRWVHLRISVDHFWGWVGTSSPRN
jgi:hypothetical protein